MSGLTLSTQDSTERKIANDQGTAPAIATQVAEQIGTARFNLWFSRRSFVCNTDELNPAVLIYAENEFSLLRIQNSFGQAIRQVVDRVAGPQYELQYLVVGKASPSNQQSCDSKVSQADQDSKATVDSIDQPEPSDEVPLPSEPISINEFRPKASENRSSRRHLYHCLLYTSPSPRDQRGSRMPSSA